ncbi:hypothetical protein ACFVYP_32765 [Kitasatospora sp. NPDC058201]|uniref:hypothetical protein n=1 Tax=Streptomycetaceae TaxID=2062 RepID=UPI002E786AF4|nr:hypothetical protein [Streptomyces sp. BE303]MED7949887.1 hypothetical protein [Streptomyces sp. BE303]
MTGTVITDLRRRGAVDPSRVLTGPLRAVGLQWLDPGRSAEVVAEGVERALYITAGSGTATAPGSEASTAPDSGIPLVEGTAVTLPLGTGTVLTAGTAGLEFFHAVLAVAGHPGRAAAHPAAGRPTTEHRPVHPDRPAQAEHRADPEPPENPERGSRSGGADRPGHPDRPENPPSPKGGESR